MSDEENRYRHLETLGASDKPEDEPCSAEPLEEELEPWDEGGEPQGHDWERGEPKFWQQSHIEGDGNSNVMAGKNVVIGNVPKTVLGKRRPRKAIRVLFLGADSSDSGRLRVDRESTAIDKALAHGRGRFVLHKHLAVEVRDLHELLLRSTPHIVHFSGHGEEDVLYFDDAGGSAPPTAAGWSLADLLAHFRQTVRCVFLNACQSERLARRIARTIDCAVGMSRPIRDEAAIELASGFYTALAHGRGVGDALRQGCRCLDLQHLEGSDVPRIIWRRSARRDLRFH